MDLQPEHLFDLCVLFIRSLLSCGNGQKLNKSNDNIVISGTTSSTGSISSSISTFFFFFTIDISQSGNFQDFYLLSDDATSDKVVKSLKKKNTGQKHEFCGALWFLSGQGEKLCALWQSSL